MSIPTTLHIINHTHWDREWFLTSEYTSRWIPPLIDRIAQIAAENPDFRFLFDGQTLVVEDLLAIAPQYEERLRALITAGHLQIGPYYCQPDWRLSSGELLIRNLLHGQQDLQAFGEAHSTDHAKPRPPAGWLVDTFGHISQAPQIHRLFGIDAVFVWRGAPLLEPYFTWQGPDGSALLTVNLFGGYRNLYGVTHVPEIALRRLQAEVDKLQPFYPTPDLPLFDGYDLEDDPEDPVRFYAEQLGAERQPLSGDFVLKEATPTGFARAIARKELPLPTVHGELNSGKFGATFPGTLSARTYLKVMARDCERLLFRVVEPLATLGHLRGKTYDEARYAAWTRSLLQNAVHDCICGVSIDLVHEKMEDGYRRLFTAMTQDLQASLQTVLSGFQSGDYAVSTNPFATESWQAVGPSLLHARTEGIGVWPLSTRLPLEEPSEPLPSFTWRNEHYEAHVHAGDGTVQLASNAEGERSLGSLLVFREHGDTYSTEPGPPLGRLQLQSPLTLVQRSERHAVLQFEAAWRGDEAWVTATVRLWFDPSPLIRWQVDLDSHGTDLRVDMLFATGAGGPVYAGMPFDIARRPITDRELLPRELPAELANVLLGQRELDAVSDFPMHDFVIVAGDQRPTMALFTQGIRAYRSAENGRLALPLRRAVQWLTRANLRRREGDAGPFFYVPDARCERPVRHEVAVAVGPFDHDAMALQKLNEAYQNPPLLVRVQSSGSRRRWQFLQEDIPLSSLCVNRGTILARFYNPLQRSQPFSRRYRQTDVWGRETGTLSAVAPGAIVTVQPPYEGAVPSDVAPLHATESESQVALLTPPPWRVGANRSRPDPDVLHSLQQKIAALSRQIASLQQQLDQAHGAPRMRLQHQIYILQREQLEYRLSLLLNRRKLQEQQPPGTDYLYTPDPQIAAVGQSLNRLRIKRRIFDYVVQAL